MQEKTLDIRIEHFEGPLDLLLSLIEKNKMDIYNISIHEITKQYLEHIARLDQKKMEVASEFLVMASRLLYIKSRMLLPKKQEVEEDDPRSDLILQLLAYKRCKILVNFLKEQFKMYAFYAEKPESFPEELGLPKRKQIYPALNFSKFEAACQRVVERNALRFNDLSKKMTRILKRERRPMYVSLTEIWTKIQQKKKLYFEELLSEKADRVEELGSFLALLELVRLDEVKVEQSESFKPLLIECEKIEMSEALEHFIRDLKKEEQNIYD